MKPSGLTCDIFIVVDSSTKAVIEYLALPYISPRLKQIQTAPAVPCMHRAATVVSADTKLL